MPMKRPKDGEEFALPIEFMEGTAPRPAYDTPPEVDTTQALIDTIMKIMSKQSKEKKKLAGQWRESSIEHNGENVELVRLEIPANIHWKVGREGHPGQTHEVSAKQVMAKLAKMIDASGTLRTVRANVRSGGVESAETSNVIEVDGKAAIIIKAHPAERAGDEPTAGEQALSRLKDTLTQHNIPRQEWSREKYSKRVLEAREIPLEQLPGRDR